MATPKKQTREELAASLEAAWRSESRYMLALNALLDKNTIKLGRYKLTGGDGAYDVFVAAPADSHGGLLVYTFRYKGQRGTTTVELLDEIAHKMREQPTGEWAETLRPAVDKALRLREEMIAKLVSSDERVSSPVPSHCPLCGGQHAPNPCSLASDADAAYDSEASLDRQEKLALQG